jgi:periplasmic protein TonB
MMKRNEEKVPKFDEIIFENRNREYGAYDLRKRYKNVTSFSILGTVAIFTIIMLVISFTSKTAVGEGGKGVIIIIQPEKYRPPETVIPKVEPPKGMIKQAMNVTPKVVEDSAAHDLLIPITEELVERTVNGDTNDIAVVTGPPEDIVPAEKKIFIIVEEPAMYPGGDGALLEYIGKNLIYPEEAIANNIQGRVTLKFVVTEDGSVGEIVLVKGVDPLLDKEAMRVIGTLPRFRAGRQSGTPVCVWYTVPVLFRLISN